VSGFSSALTSLYVSSSGRIGVTGRLLLKQAPVHPAGPVGWPHWPQPTLCFILLIGVVLKNLEDHAWYIVSERSVLLPQPLADGLRVLVLGELACQLTHRWAVYVSIPIAWGKMLVASLGISGDGFGTEAYSLCYVLVKVFGAGKESCHIIISDVLRSCRYSSRRTSSSHSPQGSSGCSCRRCQALLGVMIQGHALPQRGSRSNR